MKNLKKLILLLLLLGLSNHQFSQNKDSRVWQVIKISYNVNPPQYTSDGLGTAFFIGENICITAFHVMRDTTPREGYSFYEFCLANTNGDVLGPLVYKIGSIPDDIAVCKVNTKNHDVYVWKYTDKFSAGDKVYSVGFPPSEFDKFIIFDYKALGNPVEADTINIYSTEFNGNIIQEDSLDITIQGQFFENKKVIVLDYASVGGCSGSPLILSSTNEVVGVISFGSDPKYSITMASRLKDIIPGIEANKHFWR